MNPSNSSNIPPSSVWFPDKNPFPFWKLGFLFSRSRFPVLFFCFNYVFYPFFRNSKVSCAIFLFAVNVWGENLIQFFPGVSITGSQQLLQFMNVNLQRPYGLQVRTSIFWPQQYFFPHRCKPFLSIPIRFGEVAEWSKAVDSKSIVRLRVPGVRIPPSPPSSVNL